MGEERQYLKHGKALCGKVFAKFVETFNWLVDFGTNLKGDADVNEKQGRISVDRSDPRHPVIRFVANDKSGSGTGTGGYDPDDETPEDEDEKGCVTSLNGETGDLVIIGGKNIKVETDGKTIIISYEAGKSPDPIPEEPTDPCDHPGGGTGSAGGVPTEDNPSGGTGGGGGLGGNESGGVEAGDGTEHGNPCVSENCGT